MIKKTALMIDVDKVSQVGEILGTRSATETIDKALQEIISREQRRQLVEYFASRDAEQNLSMLDSWS
jgi:hypothetical protein